MSNMLLKNTNAPKDGVKDGVKDVVKGVVKGDTKDDCDSLKCRIVFMNRKPKMLKVG